VLLRAVERRKEYQGVRRKRKKRLYRKESEWIERERTRRRRITPSKRNDWPQ
jgi:hypothetical protein